MLLARRAMMGKKGRLPADYQEVEWIGADGNQWVNTGFAPNNDSIVSEFVSLPKNTSYEPALFSIAVTQNVRYRVGLHPRMARIYYYFLDFVNYQNLTYPDYAKYSFSKNGLYINDVKRWGVAGSGTFVGNENKMVLFGLANASEPTSISNGYVGRIKYFKTSYGDEAIRHFIPCYRKSDNEIGMYDLCGSICPLTGTPFYINAGTGTFTKGPNV